MDSDQSDTNNESRSPEAQSSSSDLKPIMSLMEEGISPRLILNQISPGFIIPPDADNQTLWRMIMNILDPPRRKKLTQYNTLEDAVKLIGAAKNIVVLSGAGISTSAGIPDFRSRDGLYVQIHEKYPDLRDPKLMFDINYFRRNPLPFYQFAKALFPGQFKPTIGHKFIKIIEDHGKLLRNYTQNIDTLEKQTGIQRVIECHGSFAMASCTRCGHTVDGLTLKDDVFSQTVPRCPKCPFESNMPQGLGVMKPNIVFFGEQLGDEFHRGFDEDRDKIDLLIVIGSSLKVRPVALIPKSIPPDVPQILINREPLEYINFDIELLGNCDDIIQELCLRLGNLWASVCESDAVPLSQIIGIPKSLLNNGDRDKSGLSSDKEEHTDEANDQNPGIAKNIEITGDISDVTQPSSDSGPLKEGSDQTRSGDDQNDDDDWEDVEIIGSTDSSECESQSVANFKVTEKSFIHVERSVYLFNGVELTRAQLRRYTKESTKPIEVKHEASKS